MKELIEKILKLKPVNDENVGGCYAEGYLDAIESVVEVIESYSPWHPWPAEKPNRDELWCLVHWRCEEEEEEGWTRLRCGLSQRFNLAKRIKIIEWIYAPPEDE